MALPIYLAMTGAELAFCQTMPEHPGYMACHFSPWDKGLSNFPGTLPDRAMLIVNDLSPMDGHDPELIFQQVLGLVRQWNAESVLLDFQRENCPETAALAQALTGLPCPVGISAPYAQEGNPVFLPPCPPDQSIEEYLRPWGGWEIWLEYALAGLQITLTERGAEVSPLEEAPESLPHGDDSLLCHYKTVLGPGRAEFLLYRTGEDREKLLERAASLGATRAIGLYQELAASGSE